MFGYEIQLFFPTYVSDQKSEDSMDLLLLIDDDKSHYVYIKEFDRVMFHTTRNESKKWFSRSSLQSLSSESVLTKYKKNCLSINRKQSVKLEKEIIEFENYFKQIPVPYKIFANFECNLRGVECYEGSYTKNIKITFVVVLIMKLFVLMIDILSQLLFLEVKMQLMNLLIQFLRSINIANN